MLGTLSHNLLVLVILAKAFVAASSRRVHPHTFRPSAKSCADITAAFKGALQIWIRCGGHRNHSYTVWCHHHSSLRHRLKPCLLRHNDVRLHHHLRLHLNLLLILAELGGLSDNVTFCDRNSFCLSWLLIRYHIY